MRPPIAAYAKVTRCRVIQLLAWLLFVAWLPLALLAKLASLTEAVLRSMDATAQKDIAAVKAWKAWRELPPDQMYLTVCYGGPKDRYSVGERLCKLEHWSKEAGSPLAHWTDAMWSDVGLQVRNELRRMVPQK